VALNIQSEFLLLLLLLLVEGHDHWCCCFIGSESHIEGRHHSRNLHLVELRLTEAPLKESARLIGVHNVGHGEC
jgi:hypothetical protein